MRYTEHRQFKLVVCTIRPREKLGIKGDLSQFDARTVINYANVNFVHTSRLDIPFFFSGGFPLKNIDSHRRRVLSVRK